MLNTKHRYALLGLALSSFFALVQFRLIIMLFDADYGRAVDAALGVLDGRPHWRQFQARVLAPFLINVVSPLFPSFYAAHVGFSIATLAVMGYLAWRLGWRIGANLVAAMLALFVFETSFFFLLSPPWLYAWDYLDIIVFRCLSTSWSLANPGHGSSGSWRSASSAGRQRPLSRSG